MGTQRSAITSQQRAGEKTRKSPLMSDFRIPPPPPLQLLVHRYPGCVSVLSALRLCHFSVLCSVLQRPPFVSLFSHDWKHVNVEPTVKSSNIIYVCVCVCVWVCRCMSWCVSLCVCLCTCVSMFLCVCVYGCVCVCVRMCVCMSPSKKLEKVEFWTIWAGGFRSIRSCMRRSLIISWKSNTLVQFLHVLHSVMHSGLILIFDVRFKFCTLKVTF